MKKILLSISFILILLIILNMLSEILIKKFYTFKIDSLYNEKQIDILFVGGSTTHHAISPMYIWNKYKIKSINIASPSQHEQITLAFIKEFLKKKPKFIVFDISILLLHQKYTIADIAYLNSICNIFLRYDTAKILDDKKKYELLNTFYLYHNRWKQLEKIDYENINYLKGHSALYDKIYKIVPQQKPDTNHIEDMDFITYIYEYVKILKEIAQQNDIKLLFISTPLANKDARNRLPLVYNFNKIADKYDLDYLNFTELADNIGIDYKHDFCDNTHINLYGGYKVTDYLIQHINKKYNLTKNAFDEQWNKDFIRYSYLINKNILKHENDFQKWSTKIDFDNYIVIVSTRGNNVLNNLSTFINKFLHSMNLEKYILDKSNKKYIAIVDNKQATFESMSDTRIEYKGRIENNVNLFVCSELNKAEININGKQRSKNKYGINFVVYDKVNREVIDSIWIDPKEPNKVRR